MRLVDRYLLRELLLPLAYCLSGFLVFWISFDLISEMDQYQQNHLGMLEIAKYYAMRMPELLVVILPVTLLLAFLYALTTHARHNEILAMRVAGHSLWRISLPYLGVGVVFGFILFYLNEVLAPLGAEGAERIMYQHQTNDMSRLVRQQLHFKNDWANRIWSIQAYHLEIDQMYRPQVEWTMPDGRRLHIIADFAKKAEQGWTFMQNVTRLEYNPGQDAVPLRIQTNQLTVVEFTETPELIRSEIKISGLNVKTAAKRPILTIEEVFNYLRLHRHLTADKSALLYTQLFGRLAEPLTCVVVVLAALPFAAFTGRRNAFVGAASSIFICFTYFVVLRLGLALGTGGFLPPFLAAFLPNLLFAGLGAYMTHRVQ
jgi:lipopolysaccharide export system permease protein